MEHVHIKSTSNFIDVFWNVLGYHSFGDNFKRLAWKQEFVDRDGSYPLNARCSQRFFNNQISSDSDTVFQFLDKIADIFFGKGIPPPNDGALVFND